jgi:hypothetical protein
MVTQQPREINSIVRQHDEVTTAPALACDLRYPPRFRDELAHAGVGNET